MDGQRKPRVLIANRGEIARRVIRSARALGVEAVTVFTEPDALSLHVSEGNEAVCLGASPREYTNAAKLLEAAKSTGCCAVHPGYGFLSENADFVEACEQAGIEFLGPTAETMRAFSRKHTAREFAESAQCPVLAGSSLLSSAEEAATIAEQVGLPVLLKATGGGGGIGIYICRTLEDVHANFETAGRQCKANFGDAGVFVEKYVQHARHIEVQIFGDGAGGIVTFVERECSIQRRHQKIVEETPSPFVSQNMELRSELQAAAQRLGSAVKYRSAGTIEFLVDNDTGKFYFLEVNTRLQVEHGITEMVNKVDLVNWQLQLQVPGLESPPLHGEREHAGHAIEVRINAEDPFRDFQPSAGTLGEVSWPRQEGVRVDTWVETGTTISPHYDSLIAKLMVYAGSRQEAIQAMQAALSATRAQGVPNNLEYLRSVVADPRFAAGATTTKFLEALHFAPHGIEVVAPGVNTTVQDWPGRTGLWHIGVPPSGPMDALAFRLANALVGNDASAAGLQITLQGPSLRFHTQAIVALTGASFEADLSGKPLAFWRSIRVSAGDVLSVNALSGKGGARAYLAVSGGIDVPDYLGSKATFPAGKLGGLQGRRLVAGDLLPLPAVDASQLCDGVSVPKAWIPVCRGGENAWEVGVLPGPNAEPDYFTAEDISTLYSATYTVHYNSNELGIRLQGPKPQFARPDGGDGGSHPSNVHDHVYALGTINFTGDMPIVLTCDGPSLGGFVCPATITSTELWKMGQVAPNDQIHFKRLTLEESYRACLRLDRMVALLQQQAHSRQATPAAGLEAELQAHAEQLQVPGMPPTAAVLAEIPASAQHPGAQLRLAGDRYVQIEYGPMELDLNLRVRVDELEKWLAAKAIKGLVETSPGVRSCMIEYDQRVLPLRRLLDTVLQAEHELPQASDATLPIRVLHLPMACDDSAVKGAIQRYMRSVRSEAPYLPSNVDFVAANNGLTGGSVDVKDVVYRASYCVFGLGDVYLGAPCAVPIDPRHRLVVPKYNPARTFTQEGTVGLGGAYMCIYGMDSPGGYQLIGRTLPIWNTWGRVPPFSPAEPWLLKIFDQVRFFEVTEEELEQQRKDFKNGRLVPKIEHEEFSMREYNALIESTRDEVAKMKAVQKAAVAKQMQLDAESLQRIKAAEAAAEKAGNAPSRAANGAGQQGSEVLSTFTANVWDIKVQPGDAVTKGQTLLVLEAMKMEYPVAAERAGKVLDVLVRQGAMAQQGDTLLLVAYDS